MRQQIKKGWKWVSLPAALLLVAAVAVGAAARSEMPENAAASVDGVVITKEAVDNRLEIGLGINPQMAPRPGSSDLDVLLRQTTKQMVAEELERQEALKRGITISAEEIDTLIDQVIEDKYLGSMEKMEADFAAKGVNRQDVREEVLRQLVHQKLLESLQAEVPVTDDEVRAEYDAHLDSYVFPERRQLRQILVPDEATARAVFQRIVSGEDFATLSSQISLDQQLRKNSGMLGLVPRTGLPPELAEVGFSLELNSVSEPVNTSSGWSILRVEFISPAATASFDEKKDELREYMGNERMAKHYQKYVEETYTAYDIEYAEGYAPLEDSDN